MNSRKQILSRLSAGGRHVIDTDRAGCIRWLVGVEREADGYSFAPSCPTWRLQYLRLFHRGRVSGWGESATFGALTHPLPRAD